MVGLLDRVMKENPSLYRACVKELNKTLRTNSSFSKKAGLIVHQDDRYTNTEYFVNYLFQFDILLLFDMHRFLFYLLNSIRNLY